MGQNARGNAEKKSADFAPLAEKMRPSSLDDYVGQDKVIGTNTMLRSLIEANDVPSMILWGPPGCGKTTLARIVASNAKKNSNSRLRFVQLSATTSNVSEVREVIKIAQNEQTMFKRKTILFIDEIHRFNKLQQDTFLMHIENGTITLIGATTQNPSFQVNSALLSRCKVVVLEKLSIQSMENILTKAIKSLHGCILEEKEEPATAIEKYHHAERPELFVERNALSMLCNLCDGDGRAALNCLEIAVHSQVASHRSGGLDKMNSDYVVVKLDHIKEGLQRSHILYDKTGEEHYNCISAMQKSIRGSDANASLYWVTRMLLGGEDPLYIARRLVRTASEDIGLADPHAVGIAVSAYQACQSLGMPECDVVLAQCAIYLARAPKSTEVYSALTLAKSSIQEHNGPLPCVPLHLRNAPNITMRNLGYGKGYNPRRAMVFMPQGMQGVNFFS
uniref:ATPase WRNIP1-like n=1 Tax=Saccoglossus kowalevskii TaxID=10224 RepID=A0ABM0H1Z3_SACKO|nr:PREDICTED: ATPase WRNIP1-like [Saccoglossus kowalevskii]